MVFALKHLSDRTILISISADIVDIYKSYKFTVMNLMNAFDPLDIHTHTLGTFRVNK